jgi:small-conductance mechanosensitive channel
MPVPQQLLPAWTLELILLAAAALLAVVVHLLLFAVLRRAARRSRNSADDTLVARIRRPARWLLVVAALQATLLHSVRTSELVESLRHLFALAVIASVAWLVTALLRAAEDIVSLRYRVDVRDNLQARTIHTQFRVLRRMAALTVVLIAVGAMLMTFPRIRQLGTTLLASAGVAGLVVGMAARPLLANLIAGVQIALSQPIRLDDVVIVEGEWGRIEEIRATYVVVAIWDDRRLVVPLSFFIERPFQNWTRTRSTLLGTVFLHVDYTLPVEEARAELKRILDASEHWDQRAWGLQVTDAGRETLELRARMSAPDASAAWNLRCEVRERMVAWLQREQPGSLPRRRVAYEAGGAPHPAS